MASVSATTSATSTVRKFTKVVGNSLSVAATTTTLTVLLAYAFAYAMRRTAMPLKNVFGSVALLPLFAPSLVQALGIVFLFGRNGVINRTFNLGIDIYGFWGIVISDVFYSFPHAYLILSAALAVADARLYESAQVLGATGARIFRDITLPSTKYGILSATFVVFTIVITGLRQPDGDRRATTTCWPPRSTTRCPARAISRWAR
jgi:iron(III) transport system permease protein